MTKAKSNKATSVKATASKAAPASNKEVITPVKAPAAETIVTQVAATKADKARAIFAESYSHSPVPQRKDIINRAVAEAGLTKAGAATYLQNYKAKQGLTASKKSTPAA